MEAVAAGDIVAVDALYCAVLVVGHERLLRRQLVQAHIAGLVNHLAAGGIARRVKVFGDRGLTIGQQLPASEFLGV